ncbi:MAG: hypothetical protein ACTHOG_03655, partial [Marmoricola sp.]
MKPAAPLGAVLELLRALNWTIRADVPWPTKRGQSFDFVLVGDPGVFAVQVLEGEPEGMEAAAAGLGTLLGNVEVRPVICRTSAALATARPTVLYCTPETALDLLVGLPPHESPETIRRVAFRMRDLVVPLPPEPTPTPTPEPKIVKAAPVAKAPTPAPVKAAAVEAAKAVPKVEVPKAEVPKAEVPKAAAQKVEPAKVAPPTVVPAPKKPVAAAPPAPKQQAIAKPKADPVSAPKAKPAVAPKAEPSVAPPTEPKAAAPAQRKPEVPLTVAAAFIEPPTPEPEVSSAPARPKQAGRHRSEKPRRVLAPARRTPPAPPKGAETTADQSASTLELPTALVPVRGRARGSNDAAQRFDNSYVFVPEPVVGPGPLRREFRVRPFVRGVVVLAVVVVAAGLGLKAWPQLAGLVKTNAHPTAAFGQTIHVATSNFHPDLKLTAAVPVRGRASGGTVAYAVDFGAANAGSTSWRVPPAAAFAMVDSLGESHRVSSVSGAASARWPGALKPTATWSGRLMFR